MPKDIGHTVKQTQMYYDTIEVKGETKNLTFIHKGFFFFFSWFCQKNTKHSDLIFFKKSQKPVIINEWPMGQLLGSDVITIGFSNNPQIHREV